MTLSMKRDVAIAWIERLESLDPQLQGTRCLNDNGKMCCLGVLSEIAHEQGVINKRVDQKNIAFYGPDSHYLPEKVVEWAGIESESDVSGSDARHNPYFQGEHAAVFNDGLGKSFEEIAGLLRLELNLPKD